MSASNVAPEVTFFVIGFININKYTSASENVHLCFRKNRQLGHISVATGRIPSLFCDLKSIKFECILVEYPTTIIYVFYMLNIIIC